MPNDFCHLHVHTKFSPLDGVASPEQYMNECRERGWNAIAFTDHGNMACVPDAFFASEDFGVKYIAGCEIYFNPMHKIWMALQKKKVVLADIKKSTSIDGEALATRIRKNNHLTILCKNEIGYRNLLAILRTAWEEGFYYKPRAWEEVIFKYREGLIMLSGCMNSIISTYIVEDKMDKAEAAAKDFRKMMGDDFYLEMQMPGKKVENSHLILEKSVEIAKKLGIKFVLTNDTHYIKQADHKLQQVLMAVDQRKTIFDTDLFFTDSDEQYLKSREDLHGTFLNDGYDKCWSRDDLNLACDTTLEVADKCKTFTPDRTPKLPLIDNSDILLLKRVKKELEIRNLWNKKKKYSVDAKEVTYRQQAMIEFNRISEKGFSSYFLIMAKIVNYSTNVLELPVGPARGSAGGSLICYLLGIHSIDPLAWGLSFNRFLSPSRGGNMLKCTME